MNELQQALLESTSAIIVLPDTASDKDFLASLQLQKIAPEKIHLLAPEEKEEAWKEVLGTAQTKKEFALTVDTSLSPVEELRYEKVGK